MAKVKIWDLKQELVVFLRNKDILTTTQRGVTTNTDDGGAVTSSMSYTVATNPTLLKNIRAVKLDGSTARLQDDYTVNYNTGVISFTSAQTAGLEVRYDEGNTDKIFPDYPQGHLKLNQFPRVAVDIISGATKEIELGAGSNQTNYVGSITCYDKGQEGVEDLIYDVRSAIMNNKKALQYVVFMTPTAMGPLTIAPFGENKVFQRNQDFDILFIFET